VRFRVRPQPHALGRSGHPFEVPFESLEVDDERRRPDCDERVTGMRGNALHAGA
jgi:hypothetical protein